MTTDFRVDDWASTVGALGGVRDKSTSVYFADRCKLSRRQLTELYKQDPIVARCCDQMADDCFRTPWEFDEFDADLSAAEAMRLIKPYAIEKVLAQLFRWGALYGGAAATIGVPGEGPIDLKPGPHYRSKVLVADDCQPYEVDTGWGSESYSDVLTYQVVGLTSSAHTIKVHASRLLVYEPIPLPLEDRRASVNGWGPSLVERLWNALSKDGATAAHACAMMFIASVFYVKMVGFKAGTQTKEGQAKWREMLGVVRSQLDSLGLLAIDATDEIGNLSLSIAGAHDLMDRMRDRLAAASPMPREILFKESPTGLRGGELTGPQALWYGAVDAFRRDVATPLLDQWLRVAFARRGIRAREWSIKWAPLWVPTQAELATNQLTLAQADQIRIDSGVGGPDEFAEHRLVKGSVEPLRREATAPVVPLSLVPSPEDEVAPDAPDAPTEVAAEAMNGAQISSMVEVASNPALNREQKRAIIRAAFPTVALALVEEIVGPEVDPNAEDAGEPLDFVTVQAAAAQLGVPTRAVTRAAERGEITVKGIGAHRLVSVRELRAFLDRDGDGQPDPEALAEDEPEASTP